MFCVDCHRDLPPEDFDHALPICQECAAKHVVRLEQAERWNTPAKRHAITKGLLPVGKHKWPCINCGAEVESTKDDFCPSCQQQMAEALAAAALEVTRARTTAEEWKKMIDDLPVIKETKAPDAPPTFIKLTRSKRGKWRLEATIHFADPTADAESVWRALLLAAEFAHVEWGFLAGNRIEVFVPPVPLMTSEDAEALHKLRDS